VAKRAGNAISLAALRSDKRTNSNGCTLFDFLKGMSPKNRETVLQAILDPTIQIPAIHRELKRRGYQYTFQVVSRHRRQGCEWCLRGR
jgi:hypothetical protein